jgi:hypothetical protein
MCDYFDRQCLQVQEYALYLGFDLEADSDLLPIAKYAMLAKLPTCWTAFLDDQGQVCAQAAVQACSQSYLQVWKGADGSVASCVTSSHLQEYFHNALTQVTQYEHPLDEQYRALYLKAKAQKVQKLQ